MKLILKFATVLCLLFPNFAMAAGHSTNVYVNPLGLLFGSFNLGADFAVTEQITLGANGNYSSLSSGSTKVTGWGLGARGQFFFDQVFTDSWYAAVFFNYGSLTGESTGVADTDITSTEFGAGVGYMWIWDNFNIQFGGGVRSISLDAGSNQTTFATLEGTLPYLEFTLGYAF